MERGTKRSAALNAVTFFLTIPILWPHTLNTISILENLASNGKFEHIYGSFRVIFYVITVFLMKVNCPISRVGTFSQSFRGRLGDGNKRGIP